MALGIVILFGGHVRSFPAASLWALALPLAAAFVRGTTQPVVKLGLEAWPDPFAAVTIGYCVSALVILAIGRAKRVTLRQGDARARLLFVAVGLCNGAAVLCLYAALTRGPVTLVAPLVACYPLLTLALDRLLTGQRDVTFAMIGGIFVTVMGVALLLAA